MDASAQAANAAMDTPAQQKRRRFSEKTPSPQSTSSSSTDSFSGSPASSENDPFGDSGEALGPLPERLNFDACENLEPQSDGVDLDGEVKISKAVYNFLAYARRRKLRQCTNPQYRKRLYDKFSLKGKDTPGKIKVLTELVKASDTDNPVIPEIEAVLKALQHHRKYECARSSNALFTYQGDWGLIEDVSDEKMSSVIEMAQGSMEMQLDYDQRRVQAAVDMIRPFDSVKQLHEALSAMVLQVVAVKFLHIWGFTLELCPKTLLEERKLRLHAHVYVARKDRFRFVLTDFTFLGSIPYLGEGILGVTSTRTSSRNFSGLYYVLAPKVGTVTCATNFPAFTHFPVTPQWILTLLQSQKMTYDTARRELVRTAKDVIRTLPTIDKWRNEVQRQELKVVTEKVASQLAAARKAFVNLPEVQDWIEDHKEVKFRYKFLVLTGGSGLGKTQFAMGLVAPGRALELNMAATGDPDLRDFDVSVHDLLLFDEMAAKYIILHKKLFQAPPAMLTLGNSSTNCHAYSVWVYQKLLVVSTNRWDAELMQLPSVDADWLNANAVVIRVVAPLWVVD